MSSGGGMLKDFKAFIARGNVVDLAVGVIIGAAFGKIVTSLVNDIVMPPIGLLIGGVDFRNLYVPLNGQHYASLAEAQKAAAPTLNYGFFVDSVLGVLIGAFVVFLIVRQTTRFYPPPAVAPAAPRKTCPFCASDIPAAAKRCPLCTSAL